ncbi:MAG: SDR family oxidoreductase [Myxococcota bacterium]
MSHQRAVVLTGASSGIGAAICDLLLAQGHRVLGVARRADTRPPHANYQSLNLDLSDLNNLRTNLGNTVKSFGAVDTLISNAGMPIFGHLEQLRTQRIRAAIDVNLTSHILVTQTLLPLLKQSDHSDILFVGSESALRGGQRGTVYCAAKFALRGFAQALRQECASSGVRVTLINPGMVRTPFFEKLDFEPGDHWSNAIEASDIADAVSMILEMRPGTVIDELNLSPHKKVIQKSGR